MAKQIFQPLGKWILVRRNPVERTYAGTDIVKAEFDETEVSDFATVISNGDLENPLKGGETIMIMKHGTRPVTVNNEELELVDPGSVLGIMLEDEETT